MSDTQDGAEAVDEAATASDPDDAEHFDPAPDVPYLVEEELVTEPIVDSVALREARLDPDDDDIVASARDDREEALIEADLVEPLVTDGNSLVGDVDSPSAEEAAIHIVGT